MKITLESTLIILDNWVNGFHSLFIRTNKFLLIQDMNAQDDSMLNINLKYMKYTLRGFFLTLIRL